MRLILFNMTDPNYPLFRSLVTDLMDGAKWLLDYRDPTLFVHTVARLGGQVTDDDLKIFFADAK